MATPLCPIESAVRDEELGFDPHDWEPFRRLAHRAVDDMVEYMRTVRERPVWRAIPDATKKRFQHPIPEEGAPLEAVYDEVVEHILPYPTGNLHPRFWSWVGGTGTPQAFLADLVVSGMNACGLGFDEAASTYVELQLICWLKGMFGFPAEASGLLVSGGSMANLVGLAVARNHMAGYDVRAEGVNRNDHPLLTFYASSETHSSVRKAIELLGLGRESLVTVPVTDEFTVDLGALDAAIAADRRRGNRPVCVIANAGTVNTGAMDPLSPLADLCQRESLWLHVDGAFGAMARVSRTRAELAAGLERADSLAFDLHKWMYQQYDIGCALVRTRKAHRDTFAVTPAYLTRFEDGLASGPTDFSAYGVQLSRSFKSLRAWITLKSEGLGKFRQLVDQNIAQAEYLSRQIDAHPRLERMAPTPLNIVNYRYVVAGWSDEQLDELNRVLLMELHTRGIAAPSSTRLHGRFAIRVAITNHRSRREDFDALLEGTLAIGEELAARDI